VWACPSSPTIAHNEDEQHSASQQQHLLHPLGCSEQQSSIVSCSPDSLTADPCCTELPAGLLLLTQLYNWNPGLGPRDSWTLHGLWPNYCNGAYPAYCDATRKYAGFEELLRQEGEGRLLRTMQRYWRVSVSLLQYLFWCVDLYEVLTCCLERPSDHNYKWNRRGTMGARGMCLDRVFCWLFFDFILFCPTTVHITYTFTPD
jgi:hypothetical protein